MALFANNNVKHFPASRAGRRLCVGSAPEAKPNPLTLRTRFAKGDDF